MESSGQAPFILETEGLGKQFAGVRALGQVAFKVRPGQIHALVGQNGAGKSTLVKILNGVHAAGSYEGVVRLNGTVVRFASPADARARGIGYVPQELQVLENLSIAENIYVGQTGLERKAFVRFSELNERAAGLLNRLGVGLDGRAPLASLSAAQKQLVMIARALATSPSVLMLDEPTASLSVHEVDRLFLILERLRSEGVTMILITHRIPEVLALADWATVLRDGQVVAEIPRAEFHEDAIVAAMVGRRLDLVFPPHDPLASPEELLRVEHLRIRRSGGGADLISDVSLSVRRGEIVGLAGLVGAGRTEVLSALYGRIAHEGRLVIEGREVTIRRPADAIKVGIAMLTEDRKNAGLLFNLPLGQNITLGNLRLFARYGILDREREDQTARASMKALDVKAPSIRADVAHLSGGNQQKALLARVLVKTPKILLLDEPTKGVDVGTKREIYRLILALADRGLGLIVVSSELPELLGLCDRCLVLSNGRIVDEFAKAEGSEERILQATARTPARAG
ncbi:MAG TPA: sugar ABC transporter ATP-binding protein [Chloroflexota bacterium]|jgi:ribose transport system ATP-binding protein/D-xylose transport system ATP-binding protein